MNNINEKFSLLVSGQQEYAAQNQGGAEGVHEAEGDMEQKDGERNRGQRLDRAEDAGLRRLDVFQAAEITAEGDDGAENDDIGVNHRGRRIPMSGKAPRGTEKREHDAADKHTPADNQRRSPFADQSLRLHGVESGG